MRNPCPGPSWRSVTLRVLLLAGITASTAQAQTWREQQEARRQKIAEQRGQEAEDRLDHLLLTPEDTMKALSSLVQRSREDPAIARQLLEFPSIVRQRLEGNYDWSPTRRDMARYVAGAVMLQIGSANHMLDFFEVAEFREYPGFPEFAAEPLGGLTRAVVSQLLERDNHTPHEIRRTFLKADPGLRPWILHAIGGTREASSITLLLNLFGADPSVDATVLSIVNSLAATIEPPQSLPSLLPINHALANGSLAVRKQAALALGRLKNFESVPLLVELLLEEDPALQRCAHWSLKTLSGTTLRLDHWTWERWLEREHEWWRERGAETLKRLHHGSLPQRMAAIKEITHHPLFRSKTASELTLVLHKCSAGEARLACFALGEFGLAPDLEPLIVQLEHPQESVREAAHTALQRLTGEDHGEDPGAWRYH